MEKLHCTRYLLSAVLIALSFTGVHVEDVVVEDVDNPDANIAYAIERPPLLIRGQVAQAGDGRSESHACQTWIAIS